MHAVVLHGSYFILKTKTKTSYKHSFTYTYIFIFCFKKCKIQKVTKTDIHKMYEENFSFIKNIKSFFITSPAI